jgi:hypothetical protein
MSGKGKKVRTNRPTPTLTSKLGDLLPALGQVKIEQPVAEAMAWINRLLSEWKTTIRAAAERAAHAATSDAEAYDIKGKYDLDNPDVRSQRRIARQFARELSERTESWCPCSTRPWSRR